MTYLKDFNYERLTEVQVTQITKSERKNKTLVWILWIWRNCVNVLREKSIFGWATWEIHATTFISSFSLYPGAVQSDITTLDICQWCLIVTDSTSSHDFNTSSSSENIKILLRPSGGEFIILLLANFPHSEHTLLIYWHDILHISTHQYISVRSGETHW